ncbi:hypothetical protein FGO68_gene4298 [Halteria grandinella]|uniref:Uncharacterized protein n=1 Tax=Halteria grandinella TaxID=5974 RepID=A0A8J8T898_HALGN|nr:hypothetical protein FGO68_gene4298 [Halteria grandinella]
MVLLQLYLSENYKKHNHILQNMSDNRDEMPGAGRERIQNQYQASAPQKSGPLNFGVGRSTNIEKRDLPLKISEESQEYYSDGLGHSSGENSKPFERPSDDEDLDKIIMNAKNLNAALPPDFQRNFLNLGVSQGIENFNPRQATSILYESQYFEGSVTDAEDESVLSQLEERQPTQRECAQSMGVREACLAQKENQRQVRCDQVAYGINQQSHKQTTRGMQYQKQIDCARNEQIQEKLSSSEEEVSPIKVDSSMENYSKDPYYLRDTIQGNYFYAESKENLASSFNKEHIVPFQKRSYMKQSNYINRSREQYKREDALEEDDPDFFKYKDLQQRMAQPQHQQQVPHAFMAMAGESTGKKTSKFKKIELTSTPKKHRPRVYSDSDGNLQEGSRFREHFKVHPFEEDKNITQRPQFTSQRSFNLGADHQLLSRRK